MDEGKLMQIFGTDELVKLFIELDRDNQNKILTTSFRKASKLIIDQASNNLRGSYKHVQASLGEKAQKDIQTLNVGTIKKRGGHLAHIANAGTKERFTKDGQSRGKITGNYFWNNAIASTAANVEETIYKDIKDRFSKLIQQKNNTK